jgi:hypothetical protein
VSEDKKVRDAAVQSLVSNLVYVAVMLGLTVAIARRDWIEQQRIRIRRWFNPPDPYAREMEEVRRDIDRLEYGYGRRERDGGCGC